MIRIILYADCDIETAESIIRSAFRPYKIEIDIESSDVSSLAAILGSKGGSSKSKAKQAASRANGRKGGRPRKDTAAPPAPRRKREQKAKEQKA